MNILFLTKSKKYTCKTLEYLLKHHTVVGVVCKKKEVIAGTELEDICRNYHIDIFENNEVYRRIEQGKMPHVDLAISNTYGRFIRKELIEWTGGNCINFHGAILPKYKGLYTYNHGLLNGEKEWGVTAHYVNERFDEGDIIRIKKFPINADSISVKELESETQKVAYTLTLQIVEEWEKNGALPSIPQDEEGKYYSLEDFEREKKVSLADTAEVVKRKIHAFWCPPYEGAYVEIDGIHFQLLPLEEGKQIDK